VTRLTKIVEIGFSSYDYTINGKFLHEWLFKGLKAGGPTDFGQNGSSHMATSIICEPNALKRLSGDEVADLPNDLTSIYLCGYCGGYDGTLVGVLLEYGETDVFWRGIGRSSDCEEDSYEMFDRVPDFCFSRKNYDEFLKQASNYKLN